MRFIALLALILTSSAFAQEYVTKKVSFTIPTLNLGTQTFYNCDSVESLTAAHIKTLGGENVKVTCTGGIDTWNPNWSTAAFVSAKFDALMPTGDNTGGQERFMVRSSGVRSSDCQLNVFVMDKLVKAFPAVQVLERKVSCRGARGTWSYDIQITY
jgi:hypothetical protein